MAGCKPARPPGRRPVRWSDARWYSNAPPRRPFQGSREPGYWRPRFFREERRSNRLSPPEQRPGEWRFAPTPRRGPPVAVVDVPRWHQPVVVEERRSRGPEPRGPLRGGPERSADDPPRKPRDSPCGGPGRSSDDPRLSKTTQAKAKREAKERREETGQLSSRWTKAARKNHGGRSPAPLQGKRDASVISRNETPRSSSRKAVRRRK